MDSNHVKQLHRKYSHGKYKKEWLDIVWTHSNIVLEISNRIVQNLKKKNIFVNEDLLKDGVLVHDIGVYSCFDEDLNPSSEASPYIEHGICGYNLLRKEGVSESIARFAICHTGVGLMPENFKNSKLELSNIDMFPISLEEEILCYSDKFHTKYPSFTTFEEQRKNLMKYDKKNGIIMDRLRLKFGIPNIEDIKEKYEPWNRKVDKFLSSI